MDQTEEYAARVVVVFLYRQELVVRGAYPNWEINYL